MLLTDQRGAAGKAKDAMGRAGDWLRGEAAKQHAVATASFGKGPVPVLGQVTRRAHLQGAVAGGAAALGGAALLRRAMKPASTGSRLVSAIKAHKGKLMAGAAGGAGLAGLAAYKRSQGK